jgi:isopenicillin-N N-acyltransferase-like protein
MVLLDLPTLTVRGTPRQLGEQHGEALRSQIAAFVPMRFEATMAFLQAMGQSSLGVLVDTGRQCMAAYAQWDPRGYEEHCAIARAAGVDAAELYTAANMTDVRDVLAYGREVSAASPPADAEGCTALLLPATWTASGADVAAQTWDLNPQDLEYVVAIHRLPDDAPETWSVTCTGCLSLVGMNAAGLAVGTTNIKTHGSRIGVGYMGVLHRMLASRSFDEAAAVCRTAPRAAAHTYWLASQGRLVEWETTAWSAQERPAGRHWLARSNHCLLDAHARAEGEPPSTSSRARLARAASLLDARHDHNLASLQAIFADRSDGVDSINRWPEDDQGTATNSVVVCQPEGLAMWACRGPADRGRWQQLHFERPE